MKTSNKGSRCCNTINYNLYSSSSSSYMFFLAHEEEIHNLFQRGRGKDEPDKKGDLFYVRYLTLLHLPPLRFHCVGGCWARTQDSCDYVIDCQTILPLGLISSSRIKPKGFGFNRGSHKSRPNGFYYITVDYGK